MNVQQQVAADYPAVLLLPYFYWDKVWSNSSQGDKQWKIRECDAATEALQKVSKINLGYENIADIAKKDLAVQKAKEWCKSQNWQLEEKHAK